MTAVNAFRVAAVHRARWERSETGRRATLSFLTELAGRYQRHEHALEANRAVWLAEVGNYQALTDSRPGQRGGEAAWVGCLWGP